MRYRILVLSMLSILYANPAFRQSTGKFDIVSYHIPQGWVREEGKDVVAYTLMSNVFITNTEAYESDYENFGISLEFSDDEPLHHYCEGK